MKTLFQIIAVIICKIFLCTSLLQAEDIITPPDIRIQAGDRYFLNNQYFSAVNEYEQAVQNGVIDPDLFRKLSFLYYHLGFLEKAVIELEKAIKLSPDSELFRMELGVTYLAKNNLDNAKEQFVAVLTRNPGLANPYYYLGEIFYRNKDYGTAWLFAKRARCLGHRGGELIMKLSAVSGEPEKDPCISTGEDLYVRQILVDTENSADEVIKRIAAGELFEDVAMEVDMNRKFNVGGYLGKFAPSELHPDIVKALAANKAFSAPFTFKTDSGFHIMQRIAPFDIAYREAQPSDSARQNEKPPLSSAPADKLKKEGFAGALVIEGNDPVSSNNKETYIVYAGSFRKQEYAIEAANKLHDLGYASYRYEELTESKEIFHIVVAGKYESFEKAKAAGEDIVKYGFNYFIRKAN